MATVTYGGTTGKTPDGGSIRVKFVDGVAAGYVDDAGNAIDSQGRPASGTVTRNESGQIVAKDAADAYSLHLSTGEPLNTIAYPQADGSVRPPTAEEVNPSLTAPKLFDATTVQGWKDVGLVSLGAAGPAAGAVIGGIAGGPTGALAGYGLGKAASNWANGEAQKSLSSQTGGGLGGPDSGGGGGGGGGGDSKKALTDYTNGLITDAKNFQPMAAPTVAAPGAVNATTINAPTLDFKAGLVADQVGAQAPVVAQKVDQPTGVQAQQVAIPGGVQAGTVTAERIGSMSADPVKDITLEGTKGRDAQYDALGMLKGAADGTAPSQAQWLLQKGVDQSVGSAYGLAASLQGRNAGLALRTGSIAAKNAIAASAADMAALRADEMAKARGAYSTAAGQIADQDFKVLASNQTKDLTLSVENLKGQIDIAKANQDAALRAGQSNAANDLSAKIATMQSQLDAAKSNADRSLAADTSTMIAKLDASKADAANALTASITNATNELNRLISNRDAALRAADANQVATLNAQIEQMKAKIQADSANQTALLEAAKATASNTLSASTSSADLAVKTQAINNEQDYNLKQLGLTGLIGQLNAEQAAAKLAADKQAASDSYTASILQTGGKVGVALYDAYNKSQTGGSTTTGTNGAPLLE